MQLSPVWANSRVIFLLHPGTYDLQLLKPRMQPLVSQSVAFMPLTGSVVVEVGAFVSTRTVEPLFDRSDFGLAQHGEDSGHGDWDEEREKRSQDDEVLVGNETESVVWRSAVDIGLTQHQLSC